MPTKSADYYTLELRRIDGHAQSARAQVAGARTLAEAVRAGNVHLPGWARSLAHSLPSVRGLQGCLTLRLETLVRQQFTTLKALPAQERLTQLGLLEQSEWVHLRGAHAQVLMRAAREAQLLRHQARQEIEASLTCAQIEPSPGG